MKFCPKFCLHLTLPRDSEVDCSDAPPSHAQGHSLEVVSHSRAQKKMASLVLSIECVGNEWQLRRDE